MILEILTLLILAAVVAVKYTTHKRSNNLRHRLVEAQNLCQRNKQNHSVLCKKHEEMEREITVQQQGRSALEANLEKLKQTLADQEMRNKELQESLR